MARALPAWAIIFLLVALAAAQNAPTTMDADDDDMDDDDDGQATSCTSANPRVGLRAVFADFEDKNIGGAIAIRDDCSIVVRGFTYDGSGEDTVLVGASTKEGLGDGIVFFELPTGKAWNGSEIVELVLDDGLSWSDFNIISCWDRTLSIDFGSVDLKTGFFPDDFLDYSYDDDDSPDFGDDDGDVDDDGVADIDDPDFDDDGDIDDDGVPDVDDPDFNDDDGDVDDDGVLNIDDPDFKDDDGDVDDDGVADIDDDGLADKDDDGLADKDDDVNDPDDDGLTGVLDGVDDDGTDDS